MQKALPAYKFRSPLLAALLWASPASAAGWAVEKGPRQAEVTVHTGRAGCSVELDVGPASATDAHGNLVLHDVEPSDHYLHVRCPGEQEQSYLVSPRAGEHLDLRVEPAAPAAPPAGSSLAAAEAKIELRRLVRQAVQSRARGHFDDAVRDLRNALKLDPGNSDLHRELGITFLLDKDWKRARAEMLEAVRHKQDDADAYNGLGYALEKLGDLKGAIPAYRTATRLEPDETSYRQHYLEALGKLAAEEGKRRGPDEKARPHRR